jgi:UDPglucose 6-dehydrogenase
VREVARGIGLDNRIGGKFLNAGPGYGGSCFPKDTLALLKTAQDFEAPQRIVEAVVAVNDNRKRAMGRKVIAACGGDVRGKRIAILGLTFKPNTDDMRDSPSIAVIQTLQDAGARIVACDPEGVEQARAVLGDVEFVAGPWEAVEGASAAVLVTEWDAYRGLELSRMSAMLAEPVLVDLRNVYDRQAAESAGLVYHAVGR